MLGGNRESAKHFQEMKILNALDALFHIVSAFKAPKLPFKHNSKMGQNDNFSQNSNLQ
jgi:hypothetical protein